MKFSCVRIEFYYEYYRVSCDKTRSQYCVIPGCTLVWVLIANIGYDITLVCVLKAPVLDRHI